MDAFRFSKRCGFVCVRLAASEAAQLEGRARRLVRLDQSTPMRVDVLVEDAPLAAEKWFVGPQKWSDEGYLVDRLNLFPEEVESARANGAEVTWSQEDIFIRLRYLHDRISSFSLFATRHLMPRSSYPKPSQDEICHYWGRVDAARKEQEELLSLLPPDVALSAREMFLI